MSCLVPTENQGQLVEARKKKSTKTKKVDHAQYKHIHEINVPTLFNGLLLIMDYFKLQLNLVISSCFLVVNKTMHS